MKYAGKIEKNCVRLNKYLGFLFRIQIGIATVIITSFRGHWNNILFTKIIYNNIIYSCTSVSKTQKGKLASASLSVRWFKPF